MASPYEQTLEDIETAIVSIQTAIYSLEEWKNGMRRATGDIPGGATITYNADDLEATLRGLRDALENAVATVPVTV